MLIGLLLFEYFKVSRQFGSNFSHVLCVGVEILFSA